MAKRTVQLSIRLSAEEKAEIERRAHLLGLTLTAYMLAACFDYQGTKDRVEAVEQRLARLEQLAGSEY